MIRARSDTLGIGVGLTLTLLLAAGLRIWGSGYDLPFIFHPDEPFNITVAQRIFKTGDLNPHYFNYPSLFFYINALAYGPYLAAGELLGIFRSGADILPPNSLMQGVTIAPTPSAVLLGRSVTICFGVGSAGLVYLIGRQLREGPWVGLLAALMVAISPTMVGLSRFVTSDSQVTFFALSSLLAALLAMKQGKTRHYVAAGLFAGLAASSKYNGALILVSLALAHAFRFGKQALWKRGLYVAAAAAAIGFIATTPYSILDPSSFMSGLRYEAAHYALGHAGMEGDAAGWYLGLMATTSGGLYLLAGFGIANGLWSRRKEVAIVVIFIAVYFAFISSFAVRNDRTFLLVAPFLFVLASDFAVDLISRLAGGILLPRFARGALIAACAGVLVTALSGSLSNTVAATRQLTALDSRQTARIWIDNYLPPKSRIAIEAYAPYVDPARFEVLAIGKMIDFPSEWYLEKGVEYLVYGEGMFGRYFARPDLYAAEISKYEAQFSRFFLEKVFEDGGYEVRIYRAR